MTVSALSWPINDWPLLKCAKTRTWFSLPDEMVFAVAEIWRDTDEWCRAYSMVMTEACIHVADVHDRMPVILRRRIGRIGSTEHPTPEGCSVGPIPS